MNIITMRSFIITAIIVLLVFQFTVASVMGKQLPDKLLYAISPDGRASAILYENNIGVVESRSFRNIFIIHKPHNNSKIRDIKFSRNNKLLASAAEDGHVQVYHSHSGHRLWLLIHPDIVVQHNEIRVNVIDFSPDNKYLAAGYSNGDVVIWDINSGALVKNINNGMEILEVKFSEQGKQLAYGGFDSTIIIFDMYTIELDLSMPVKPPVKAIHFSRDGNYLAFGSDVVGSVSVWNLQTNQIEHHLPGYGYQSLRSSIRQNSSETYLALEYGKGVFHVWNAIDPAIIRSNDEATLPQVIRERKVSNYYKMRSGLWFERTSDDIQDIILDIPDEIAKKYPEMFAVKDQFETTTEYERRMLRAASFLNEYRHQKIVESRQIKTYPVQLGMYDADRQKYPINIAGLDFTLDIDRVNARSLFDNRDNLIANGYQQLSQNLVDTEVVNISFNDPVSDQVYVLGKQILIEHMVSQSPNFINAPPRLVMSEPAFTDSDGDNVLSAGERAIIQLVINNDGDGPARNVRIEGNTDAPIFGLRANLGDIMPGYSKTVSLAIVAANDLLDGRAIIDINVIEDNGFHADPIEISIPIREFRPPVLVIHDVGVEDSRGRGIITPGQIIDVTVRVLNRGEGVANEVEAVIRPGRNVFLAGEQATTKTINIGTIEPGRYHDVGFQAFANREAESFQIFLDVNEKNGEFSLNNYDLGLELDQPQRTVRQLVVDARLLDNDAGSELTNLTISIEKEIPQAAEVRNDAVAVIIGNRTYRGDTPEVSFALRDASLVKRYVEQALGYRPGNVLYIEDATLTDFRVAFGDVQNKGGRLRELIKSGVSDVFVYYSGHGAPDPGSEMAYLVPVDGDANRLSLTGYPLETLYENLASLNAKSVTVVLDACFSGATGGGQMLIAQASPIGITVRNPASIIGNGTVIAASSGNQIASWYPEKRHGLLTYFFLKGLQGKADLNSDGYITVEEMRIYLQDLNNGLPYWARRIHGREQSPQVWGTSDLIIR